jgi:CheY-like chemotaxis protein/HPt (histidine-containing phosphotransfer) domain-containing protein
MVFKSLLKRTRVKIDTANDGDEGLTYALDKKYDIIFFDHMMPGKDGIETLYEMRAQEKNPNLDTVAVCLTANAISGARQQYLDAGFDDYLTKPVDSARLEEMLITYLPKDKVILGEATADNKGTESDNVLSDELKALESFDEIDIKAGMENSGGPDAYIPLLKIFYESMDEKASEIEGFFRDNDIKNYTIKVHALKSSARLIGAIGFSEAAQEMENAGKAEDVEYIKANHEALMKRLYKFKEPLSEVFKSDKTDSDKPTADASLIAGVYNEILSAAEDMDCDRLEQIFNEMERYRIPENEAELFNRLKDASDAFDYDSIISLLKE